MSSFAQGRDGGHYMIFDGLAKLFVSVLIVWTSFLICGCVFLVLNRNVQSVRVRNLPLAIGAVACLHVYFIIIMLVYAFNGVFPCATEYWVMSVYLPLGIALFQASNVQLLSMAGLQGRLLASGGSCKEKPSALSSTSPNGASALTRSSARCLVRLGRMTLLRKTELAIAIGIIIQLIFSTAVFLSSRKFVPFGITSEPVTPELCRRGVEWIPSILWQLVWAWVFAPYILWKIRRIHDVHNWRLQTTICVVAGLPGSPLWLISLYSDRPTWASVNKYWAPPLWFAVPIMTMEAVTIFTPCIEVVRSRLRHKYVTRIIKEWETHRRGGDSKNTSASSSGTPSSMQTATSKASRRSAMYSRTSFEKYLSGDLNVLLHFAASKEFSGENITFLTYVRDWKASWERLKQSEPNYDWKIDTAHHRMHLFKLAAEIYVECIDMKTADFPINIESHIYAGLQRIFGNAARQLSRPVSASSSSPFVYGSGGSGGGSGPADDGLASNSMIQLISAKKPSGGTMVTTSSVAASTSSENDFPLSPQPPPSQTDYFDAKKKSSSIMHAEPRLPDTVGVPEEFSPAVFDSAEESVKHMVFLNTWPKFVDFTVDDEPEDDPTAAVAAAEKGHGVGGALVRRLTRFHKK